MREGWREKEEERERERERDRERERERTRTYASRSVRCCSKLLPFALHLCYMFVSAL